MREEGAEEAARATAIAAVQQQMQCLQHVGSLDMQLHGKLMCTHTHTHTQFSYISEPAVQIRKSLLITRH